MADRITPASDVLADLIERLEKATGPDRELDCRIAVASGGFRAEPPRFDGDDVQYAQRMPDGSWMSPGQAGDMLVPHYTGSDDAAMTLVPEGDGDRELYFGKGECLAQIEEPLGRFNQGRHKVRAIALCIAALKACAATEKSR